MTEKWVDVPGWTGLYEVSNLGRVRSLERLTERGVRGGKLLKPNPDSHGYYTVSMSVNSQVARVWIHHLVLLAFVGPRPRATEVAHENGDHQDNRLTNLAYKTKSGNMLDSVRHGTHRNSRKAECPKCSGPYSINYRGQRYCPSCRNEYQRERYVVEADVVSARQRESRQLNLERRREIERESKRRARARKKAMT